MQQEKVQGLEIIAVPNVSEDVTQLVALSAPVFSALNIFTPAQKFAWLLIAFLWFLLLWRRFVSRKSLEDQYEEWKLQWENYWQRPVETPPVKVMMDNNGNDYTLTTKDGAVSNATGDASDNALLQPAIVFEDNATEALPITLVEPVEKIPSDAGNTESTTVPVKVSVPDDSVFTFQGKPGNFKFSFRELYENGCSFNREDAYDFLAERGFNGPGIFKMHFLSVYGREVGWDELAPYEGCILKMMDEHFISEKEPGFWVNMGFTEGQPGDFRVKRSGRFYEIKK